MPIFPNTNVFTSIDIQIGTMQKLPFFSTLRDITMQEEFLTYIQNKIVKDSQTNFHLFHDTFRFLLKIKEII